MFFSIVTLTKDDSLGFSRTAESIFVQTFTDFEWIVCDASTSSSLKSSNLELANHFQRVIFVGEDDTSIYNAMNLSKSYASGDFLIFLNGGDHFYDSNSLNLVYNTLSKNSSPQVIACAGTRVLSGTRSLYSPPRNFSSCIGINSYRMCSFHQSQFISSEIYQNLHFREYLSVSADHAFFWDAIARGSSIVTINYPVSVFYRGGFSSAHKLASLVDLVFCFFYIQRLSALMLIVSIAKVAFIKIIRSFSITRPFSL